jgi:acetyl-CoA acetyltransferase/uncharacterized OB-fold protein
MTPRVLPALNDVGDFYWRSGADGVLRIAWCKKCAVHLHPSTEVCPSCLGTEIDPIAIPGEAIVVACTENRQAWLPGHPPPYVVAIVALTVAPQVRLTTNIVGCAPNEVVVGMPVRVRFEQHAEVWLPLFEPVPDGTPIPIVDELPPRSRASAISRGEKFEDKVAITGIGQSALGRRLPQSSLVLTLTACGAAIDDAGLSRDDIDGICGYPGSEGLPGVSDGGVRAVERVLHLRPVWHCGMHEVPGQTGNLIAAMLAIAAGLCRHVLCFTNFSQARRPGVRGGAADGRISGELAWQLPYGAASPANWIALYASNYLARYHLERQVLAGVAIAARQHAARNPLAIYAEPLTLEDYLSARLISWPFGLYDCDVPCDGAMAVVISRRDIASDLRHRPVLVESVGTQITEHQSWDQHGLTHQRNVFGPASHLWSRTDLTPADIDVALLYDGFTFNVFSWLEGLGFCAPGEAAEFIAGGARIGPGGSLPLNPHGGQLAAGRTNGYGNVLEAVHQLRGHAGPRQVDHARVAVVSSGGGIPASCMLLSQSP